MSILDNIIDNIKKFYYKTKGEYINFEEATIVNFNGNPYVVYNGEVYGVMGIDTDRPSLRRVFIDELFGDQILKHARIQEHILKSYNFEIEGTPTINIAQSFKPDVCLFFVRDSKTGKTRKFEFNTRTRKLTLVGISRTETIESDVLAAQMPYINNALKALQINKTAKNCNLVDNVIANFFKLQEISKQKNNEIILQEKKRENRSNPDVDLYFSKNPTAVNVDGVWYFLVDGSAATLSENIFTGKPTIRRVSPDRCKEFSELSEIENEIRGKFPKNFEKDIIISFVKPYKNGNFKFHSTNTKTGETKTFNYNSNKQDLDVLVNKRGVNEFMQSTFIKMNLFDRIIKNCNQNSPFNTEQKELSEKSQAQQNPQVQISQKQNLQGQEYDPFVIDETDQLSQQVNVLTRANDNFSIENQKAVVRTAH